MLRGKIGVLKADRPPAAEGHGEGHQQNERELPAV